MLCFKVDKLKLTRIDKEFVVNKTENFWRAVFVFNTDDWQGKSVMAYFEDETGTAYKQLLDADNSCIIPFEVLTDNVFKVGLFAVQSPVLMRTNAVRVRLAVGCGTDGQLPSTPTPTEFEQILNVAKEAKATANDVKTRADNGEFDGKDGTQIEVAETDEGIVLTVKKPTGADEGDIELEEYYFINHGKDYVLTDSDKQDIANIVSTEYFAELETMIDDSGVLDE